MYSKSINQLISSFKTLPSVGQKTAERFVFSLLKSGKKQVAQLSENLNNLSNTIRSCKTCWDFVDTDPCPICANHDRDKTTICIIAEPQDIQVIEKTQEYKGKYFVLRGLINLDKKHIPKTKIKELFIFLKSDTEVKEIILALNSDMDGETTSLYLQKQIKILRPNIKISRLARGLPMGSDLQYADEITLSAAIKNRS